MDSSSISGILTNCWGRSSAAAKAIKSKAVNLVCLLEETKTKTGLVGA